MAAHSISGPSGIDSAQPLGRLKLFETCDLDEARERVSRLLCPHRIALAGRSTSFYLRVNHARLDSLSVSYVHYKGNVRIDPGELSQFYLIGLPLSGTTVVTCGEQRVVSKPGMAAIQTPGKAVHVDWGNSCRKMVVKIPRATLERHLADLLGRSLGAPIAFKLGIDTSWGFGASLMGIVGSMVQELDRLSAPLWTQKASRRVEEMLMTALLLGQPHNYSEALNRPVSPAVPYYVGRAEEFMLDNIEKPIALSDIVAASGVSERTLLLGFRRFRDISPMQFLKQRRLEKVREDLQLGGPGDTVTEAAIKWGFLHQGRFAHDYRRRFGETPSETLRKS